MALDKAALLAKRGDRDRREVEIPGFGSVTVRGLTRAEALRIRGRDMDEAEAERLLLAAALVEPRLTEDEVATWQEVSPAGELGPVAEAVLELSGMVSDASKEAAKSAAR
jgi:hypothetical protein